MNLNSLPKEVLLKIFSYLNITEKIYLKRVCRFWNELIFEQIKHISFVSPEFEQRISLLEPNIIIAQRLDEVHRIMSENNFTNLKSVDLIDINATQGDISLLDLSETLKDIVSLRYVCDAWVNQENITRLICRMSKLEKLSCWFIPPDDQNELATFLLKNNSIVNCLSAECIEYERIRAPMDSLSKNWKELRLIATSCLCKFGRSDVSFDLLQKLSLFTCPKMIKSGSLSNLLNNGQLKQLSLTIHWRCCERKKTNLSLPQLHSETLEVLCIDTWKNYILDNTLDIIQHLRNLKVLDMRAKRFTDGCVDLLTNNCRVLQYLRIDDGEITDNSITSLLNLPRLEVLLLIGKNEVTVGAMNDFIEKAQSLRVLSCSLQVVEAFISRANQVRNYFHIGFFPESELPQVIPKNLYLSRKYKDYGIPDNVIWEHLFNFRDVIDNDNGYFDWKRIRRSQLNRFCD
ncbi:hypothetical protein B4U80_13254 [Leptotrombidium deliense]|uniref:F-box domain-containing protein n=1 Tax=Leptotrombidium deliense TaxID=299467 RepID=A0A443S9K7_9ACAR|nr:hypothetical protein B4U80_13254 [Leptotrombidium deliense]